MPKISIIVPAYNVEKYIDRCVNSILSQTFQDYELIIVDDGSTDATSDICDSYCDARISVIHKKNGGLSDARNAGLQVAKGSYITFVDSDDYVAENYLEVLFDMIGREPDIGVAMLPGQQLLEEEKPIEYKSYEVLVLPTSEAIRRILLRKGITHSSWGKLFKRQLWQNIQFPVGQNYEDYATTYDVMKGTKKVAYTDCELYYYIQRPGSIMHQKCNEKTLSVLDVADSVTESIIHNWPQLSDYAEGLKIANYLKTLQTILNDGINSYIDYQSRIINEVKNKSIRILRNPQISFKDKLKVICIIVDKRLFLRLYNRFNGEKKVL